jgi:hypothetical protein
MEQPDMRTSGASPESNPGSASQPDAERGDRRAITDRARDIAGATRDRLADVGSTVRDRAGTLKDSLADALETGADRLRNRAPGGEHGGVALAGDVGAPAASRDERFGQVPAKVAGGMDATASWLREADLDSLKATIETQVKEHPGRTLLIAVGVGYLLGKALRK